MRAIVIVAAAAAAAGCANTEGKLADVSWSAPVECDYASMVERARQMTLRTFRKGFDPDRTDEERGPILGEGGRIVAALAAAGLKARFDMRDHLKPGPKFFEWEQKGVPLRLELGPRDLAQGQVVVVRRDDGSKSTMPISGLAAAVPPLLDSIQRGLLERATAFRDAHTHEAATFAEFERLLGEGGGFVEALCDGTDETELAIKEKTKATIRVVLEDAEKPLGKCVLTGKPATRRALFAIAY